MLTELAKVLQIIRINNNETSSEMAKKLHLSSSHLSAIEHGKRRVPKDMKNLLFSAYVLSDYEKERIESAINGDEGINKINLTSLSIVKEYKG